MFKAALSIFVLPTTALLFSSPAASLRFMGASNSGKAVAHRRKSRA